ncbi:MAG: cysteine--tRNA ligase [Thermodesulfobacteriota bacterium]
MPIQIFDTGANAKVPFQPLEDNHVRLYVCGITAYDYCHIGHARSALVFDMIVRYLRYAGYKVTFVRNFTDIDDKIINRANEQGTSSEELAERFITAFLEDMERLGTLRPDAEPRATEHLPEIIATIERLIAKGYAYQAGGDVYYSVEKFKEYGKLSGRSLTDMQAGARVSINEMKTNPMDFALWKGSKPGEPTWDSPWGPGRPGWHIECSAMSGKLLGATFDIHGGGKDLIFPHHENEIAQSEGANGVPFARHWIHHGFVTIRDEKMSKSLGNFLTIRDVLDHYQPEVLRCFVFATHYRNPLDFSETAMKDAESGLDRLYQCAAAIELLPEGREGAKSVVADGDRAHLAGFDERFRAAMDNDFNTAQALGQIFEVAKTLNRIRQALPKNAAAADVQLLRDGLAGLRQAAAVMGLLREAPATYLERKRERFLQGLDIGRADIERLIAERTAARRDRNWQRADEIRDILLGKGIELKDGPAGTTWDIAGSE